MRCYAPGTPYLYLQVAEFNTRQRGFFSRGQQKLRDVVVGHPGVGQEEYRKQETFTQRSVSQNLCPSEEERRHRACLTIDMLARQLPIRECPYQDRKS